MLHQDLKTDSRTRVPRIITVHIIITEDSIIENPIAIVDSETRTAVIRTIKATKTTADSEIPTVIADSETKAAVTRIIRVTKITVDSGTRTAAAKVAADQNLPAVDSETVPVAKAVVPADNRAAEAALDKTIINKKTNS